MAITLDGTTGVTAAEFDGTVDASNLTGTLPAIDGSALTGIESGGVTLLGTLSTTSGTSVTLSGLNLTSTKFIYLLLTGVSTNQTYTWLAYTGRNIIQLTAGGDGQTCEGFVFMEVSSGFSWSVGDVQSQNIYDASIGLSPSTTSLTFSPSNGSFDAGSIRVYGVS